MGNAILNGRIPVLQTGGCKWALRPGVDAYMTTVSIPEDRVANLRRGPNNTLKMTAELGGSAGFINNALEVQALLALENMPPKVDFNTLSARNVASLAKTVKSTPIVGGALSKAVSATASNVYVDVVLADRRYQWQFYGHRGDYNIYVPEVRDEAGKDITPQEVYERSQTESLLTLYDWGTLKPLTSTTRRRWTVKEIIADILDVPLEPGRSYLATADLSLIPDELYIDNLSVEGSVADCLKSVLEHRLCWELDVICELDGSIKFIRVGKAQTINTTVAPLVGGAAGMIDKSGSRPSSVKLLFQKRNRNYCYDWTPMLPTDDEVPKVIEESAFLNWSGNSFTLTGDAAETFRRNFSSGMTFQTTSGRDYTISSMSAGSTLTVTCTNGGPQETTTSFTALGPLEEGSLTKRLEWRKGEFVPLDILLDHWGTSEAHVRSTILLDGAACCSEVLDGISPSQQAQPYQYEFRARRVRILKEHFYRTFLVGEPATASDELSPKWVTNPPRIDIEAPIEGQGAYYRKSWYGEAGWYNVIDWIQDSIEAVDPYRGIVHINAPPDIFFMHEVAGEGTLVQSKTYLTKVQNRRKLAIAFYSKRWPRTINDYYVVEIYNASQQGLTGNGSEVFWFADNPAYFDTVWGGRVTDPDDPWYNKGPGSGDTPVNSAQVELEANALGQKAIYDYQDHASGGVEFAQLLTKAALPAYGEIDLIEWRLDSRSTGGCGYTLVRYRGTMPQDPYFIQPRQMEILKIQTQRQLRQSPFIRN